MFASKWDSPHTLIHDFSDAPRRAPAFVPAAASPSMSGGRIAHGKVYFRYALSAAITGAVECDLSPGFAVDGGGRLRRGHVRILCPRCERPVHIESDNKVVYIHQPPWVLAGRVPFGLDVSEGGIPLGHARKGLARYLFSSDEIRGLRGAYLLPVLSVDAPVRCPYIERAGGGEACRWHVVIAEGTAHDYHARARSPS